MRTFRAAETVQLNNSSDGTAYRTGAIEFNPLLLITSEEYKNMASCFEMYRVKRARVFLQPAFSAFTPSSSLVLNATAASTVWTVSDFTKNESTLGNQSIKNYQNTRFHTLSLNSLKKIIDTPVRMYRKAGTDGLLTAGVMPASYWLDTSFAQAGTFSYAQYCIELPGFDNSSVSYRPSYRFIYELDIEFKQPGTSVIPATFNTQAMIGTVLRLGTYPTGDPPVGGSFTDWTCIGFKSAEISGAQILSFRFSDGSGSLVLTATELRTVISDRLYAGQDAIWQGPPIPEGL
jgi:hypothetical protein